MKYKDIQESTGSPMIWDIVAGLGRAEGSMKDLLKKKGLDSKQKKLLQNSMKAIRSLNSKFVATDWSNIDEWKYTKDGTAYK